MGRITCNNGAMTDAACLVAIRRGERDVRFAGLTATAIGAAAFGSWLWLQARAFRDVKDR